MEKRLLFTAWTWVGGTGNWNDSTQWSDGQGHNGTPTFGDTVNITAAGSVVNVVDGERVDNITTSAGTTLQIQAGGGLFLDNGGTVSGSLNVDGVQGATTAGGIGTGFNNNALVLDGTTNLSGTISQGLFTNNGTLNLTGAGYTSSGTLTNNSTVNLTGGFGFGNGLNFVNSPTGTIDLKDNSALTGGGTINNSGTFEKTAGTGTSTISNSVHLQDSGGKIDVTTGTISDASTAYFNNTAFNVSAGTTFSFDPISSTDNSNAFLFSGESTASGAGHLVFNGGQITAGLPGAAAPEAILDFDKGVAQINSTAIDTNPQDGPVQQVTNAGFLDYTGSSTHSSMGLINQGTIRVLGSGDLDVDRNGGFTNAATGVLDFESDAGIGDFNGNTGFTNAGLIEKTGGTGTTILGTITSGLPISFVNAGGSFDVETGTISIVNDDSDMAFTAGTINVAAGAALDFNYGGARMFTSGTFSSTGAGHVTFTSGNWYSYNGGDGQTVPGVLNFAPGAFIDQGGNFVDANLTNNGTIEMNGANSLNGITNNGNIFVNGPTFQFGGTVNNNGLIDFTVAMALGQQFNPVNNNATGTIEFTGTGTLDLTQVNGLTNNGKMLVDGGTLLLGQSRNSFDFFTNTIPVGATYEADHGGTITFGQQFVPITEIDGTLILNGAGSSFAAADGVTTLTGTLGVLDGATFATTGSLTNTGTLDIGGTVTINGSLTQSQGASGTPTINFAVGALPSSNTPLLNVTGSTALAGNLTAEFTNAIGSNGDAYTVAKFGSVHSGSFASSSGVGPAFSATVNPLSIVLNGKNLAAISATADTYNALNNTALVVNAVTGLLANDTDPNGLSLTADVLTNPAHGVLLLNSDGSFTYQPLTGYTGTDSFTYYATDGAVTSAATTVTLKVGLAQAVFTNLTAPQSIGFGTSTISLGGNIGAGSVFPNTTETVAVTLNGVTQNAAIGANGAFSTTFNIATLPVSQTAYAVTYSYLGDSRLLAATDTKSTTVTINKSTTAKILLSNLDQTYTGSALAAGVSTNPGGLTVVLTYSQNGQSVASPTNAGSYAVTATIVDPNFTGSASDTLVIEQAKPAFTGLTASATITPGTSLSLGGTIKAGTLVPGGSVAVTLNGVTQNATIDADGTFSSSFDTSALATSQSYAVTYAFAGSTNFAAVSDSSTTTISTPAPAGVEPVITQDLTGAAFAPGIPIVLIAKATGTPQPTAQWQESTTGAAGSFTNVTPLFTSVIGGVTETEVYDTGSTTLYYRVTFTNASGSVTTSTAEVNRGISSNSPTLTITQNPTNATFVPTAANQLFPASVSFSASVTSSLATDFLSSAWQVSTDGGKTYTAISSGYLPTDAGVGFHTVTSGIQISPTASQAATLNGNLYRCVFTDNQGAAAVTTTSAAFLYQASAGLPTITQNPVDTGVSNGASVFSSIAVGVPTPTVQWQGSVNGSSGWTNLPAADAASNPAFIFALGTTQSTLTLPAGSGYKYVRAVFSNTSGSATSTAAHIVPVPTITAQPSSVSSALGKSVIFEASATGGSPTVQWQVNANNGAGFQNILGATDKALHVTATLADNGYQYQAVFTNAGGSVTTSIATLSIAGLGAPTIATNPTNSIYTNGVATFTASASTPFNSTPPTAVWYGSATGAPGSFIAIPAVDSTLNTLYSFTGSTSSTLSLPQSLGYVYVEVTFTNAAGSATSSTASVTTPVPPTVVVNPTNQSVAIGSTVTFSAAATGTPAPTVQWYYSSDGGANYQQVIGATSNTLTVTASAANNGYLYTAIFTNSAGQAVSNGAVLALTGSPTITTNPASSNVGLGNTVTLTAAAKSTPTALVQWQVSTNGGLSFTNITGATSTSYTVTGTVGQSGYEYRAVFTNLIGSATTTAATINLTGQIVIQQDPTTQTALAGSTVSLTAIANGTPTPTVQWQESTFNGFSNGPWQDIAGATSKMYRFTATDALNGAQFRAVFTNALGTATTAIATLTVTDPPVITLQPSNAKYATPLGSLESNPIVAVSAAAFSPTPLTIVWQGSTTGAANSFVNLPAGDSVLDEFNEIGGPVKSDLSLSQSSGILYVRAVFTNAIGTVTTKVVTLTPEAAHRPIITLETSSVFPIYTISAGGSVNLVSDAISDPPATSQWQVSTNGGRSWTNIAGATSIAFSFIATKAENGFEYRAVFTNALGSATTDPITLQVL